MDFLNLARFLRQSVCFEMLERKMGVAVLNHLGALNALAATSSQASGWPVENGLFAALFGKQMDLNNPLVASLMAENPQVAADWVKNSLELKNKNDELNVADLLAMIAPNVENVHQNVFSNETNAKNHVLLGENQKVLLPQPEKTMPILMKELIPSGNKAANSLSAESVKLADSETKTPFHAILNGAQQDAWGMTQKTPHLTVQTPIDSAKWSEQFNQQIVWAAKNDWQSAQIKITPENLGPIKIQLHIHDGKAQIQFVSAHSEVRQSISDALPQLKEMLATSGIDLGQTNVGSQDQGEFSKAFYAQEQAQKGILNHDAAFEESTTALHVAAQRVKNNLSAVDLFA